MEQPFENLCRCRGCLITVSRKDDRFVDLLEPFILETELTYLEAFNQCTKLSITEDQAHTCRYLCDVCKYELIASYQFLIKALESEEKIKQQNEQIWNEIDVHHSTENFELITTSNVVTEPDTQFVFTEEDEFANTNDTDVQSFSEIPDDNVDDEKSYCSNFQFRCEHCTAQFEFERSLIEHYGDDHDSSTFTICCEECSQRFISRNALRFHKRQVHDKIEYSDCQDCGRWIAKSFYKQHSLRHTNKVEFQCTECKTTFSSKYTLQYHMSSVHSKEDRKKCFNCKSCERSFYTQDNLDMHQTVHEKERNIFECNLCDRKFMRRSNLKLHMQMHRGITMDCIQCGKQFVRSRDLEIHLRFHTGEFPFQCDICDRRFAIKSHLKYHKRRHNGIRYECQKCKKHFLNLSGLRDHSFEHTSMPFTCDICLRGFPTKYKIRRHIVNVHRDNVQSSDNGDVDKYIKQQDVNSSAVDFLDTVTNFLEELD